MLNIDYNKADEIFEEYFQDNIIPFETNLSNLNFLDVRDILDENNIKYDDELILYILDLIADYKKQLEDEQISEEFDNFRTEMYNNIYAITEDFPHLNSDDIGKVLVQIANNYLSEI